MQTTRRGKLVPLKTALETRSRDTLVDFYITIVPIKQANTVLNIVRQALPDDGGLDIQHLRRFAKFTDLPPEVRSLIAAASRAPSSPSQEPDGTAPGEEAAENDFTNKRILLIGSINAITKDTVTSLLNPVLSTPRVLVTQVPLRTPTSQEQATRWSERYWPSVYKKSNVFGPHPSLVRRAEEGIVGEVDKWMTLAEDVARDAKMREEGEGVGVVVVQRTEGVGRVLAVAGDGRWVGWSTEKGKGGGNVTAHAAMRAIAMVALGVKAKDDAKNDILPDATKAASIFRDEPMGDLEKEYFRPSDKEGYLCHELEIYCTHEPCVMCSMAIVHSRFGKLVFRRKMQRTGGICADGELGHGLFWRKELNWTMLGWQWCPEGEEEEDNEQGIDLTLNA